MSLAYHLVLNLNARFQVKDSAAAIKYCDIAISLDETSVDLLMKRGDAHILEDNLEAAKRDYMKARELEPNNQDVMAGLQRIEKLMRSASRKDYYKILGVSRKASQVEIKKAYRKLAQQWHPDRIDEKDKEMAQKKMAEINEAYEVIGKEG